MGPNIKPGKIVGVITGCGGDYWGWLKEVVVMKLALFPSAWSREMCFSRA